MFSITFFIFFIFIFYKSLLYKRAKSNKRMERETPERSKEEEAELKRNSKKVKDSHPSFGDGSFKDKLLGDIPGAYTQAFRFNPLEEGETLSDAKLDDLTDGVASMHFSCDDKAHLRDR